MSEDSFKSEQPVETLFVAEELTSGDEPPMSTWSSLEEVVIVENVKKTLYSQGLYSPGSGEICTKYIAQSDSSILRHPYYNYPAILNPGIEDALLAPEQPILYSDNGQDLYLKICSEMNQAPVRMFHKNLLESKINLSYYGVNPNGVCAMAKALQYNKYVTCFNLTDNFLNDDSCYHLGQMLKYNNTLNELILKGCRIGATGILRLGDNLADNKTLVLLDLEGNNLEESGGEYFANIVNSGANVKKVILRNNKLGRATIVELQKVLEWRNPFTHLDLSWNQFYHMPSLAKMIDILATSKILEVLNLSYIALEGERVGDAIKNILLVPTIKILDLSHNRLQGEAVKTIAGQLIKAKKLVTFDLSFNPLSPADAYDILTRMSRPRVKLQRLLMEGIDVDQKFIVLLENVKKMKSRKNFVIVYGAVLHNWVVTGPDPRDVILKRADYLGNASKKNRVDVAQFFLRLNKEYTRPVPIKVLLERVKNENVPLGDDYLNELTVVFPGPAPTPKARSLNVSMLCEYMERLWPDRKLPPTPPPEPEPEPLPPPPPPPTKGKKKKK